jgi:hypothetical protein
MNPACFVGHPVYKDDFYENSSWELMKDDE